MSLPEPPPFAVRDCAIITLATGRSAQSLRELRDHIERLPAAQLSFPFYEALLRPAFDHPEYRNDFARWAARQLHDMPLAERLSVIDPMEYGDIEALRRHLLEVIEDRLSEAPEVAPAMRGAEFHFLRSQFVIFDAGTSASTPEELSALVPRLSTGSIFFHFIDARYRNANHEDDFSVWLDGWGERYAPGRARLHALDYSLWDLVELRARIARCILTPIGQNGTPTTGETVPADAGGNGGHSGPWPV